MQNSKPVYPALYQASKLAYEQLAFFRATVRDSKPSNQKEKQKCSSKE